VPSKLVLQRYYRPEDVSADVAYRCGCGSVGGVQVSSCMVCYCVFAHCLPACLPALHPPQGELLGPVRLT
jgi:hypothetical protein